MASISPKLRRCSQASIARDLRLSQPAVSLALNGKRHQLRPETYARIWEYALAAGYRGKGIALETSPLATGGLAHAGVIHAVSTLRLDPFFAAVQWATEELLAENGIPLIPLGAVGQMRERLIRFLTPAGPPKSAVIIMGEVPTAIVAELAARSLRLATVGWACPRYAPAVLNNEAEAALLLLSRLKRVGHTHVVWFGRKLQGTPMTAPFAPADIAARAGLSLRVEEPFTSTHASPEAGRRAARALLQTAFPRDAKPTAVLCSDLSVAQGAAEVFGSAGINVPGELSLATLGCPGALNHDASLRITTAGCEPTQIAAALVEMLLGDPTAKGACHRSITPLSRLFIGNSDGPCAANSRPQKAPARDTRPLRAA